MVATLSKNSAGTSWSLGNERSYDVWGSVRSGATTGGPKGRYVANLGHVADDESGLIYMRARYYEPESGRFVSEDPSFDGKNWYSYTKNNPINYVDKDGKWTDDNTAFVAEWVLVLAGIGLMFSGAAKSVAGRVMAITGLVFLALWFNVAIPHWGSVVDDGGQPLGMQLLFGFIASVLFERIAWAEVCYRGVADQAVGFYESYAGMLLIFIDLGLNSNGRGFMGQ